MSGHKAMGGHHSAAPGTVVWRTPGHVIEALGGRESFDLDPCAYAGDPTACALHGYALPDVDGLEADWFGRAYVNPPYTSGEIGAWLRKLADHGNGAALIFARTDTAAFHREAFEKASGALFLEGRLHFHHADGTRAEANAGAPSVILSYGPEELDRVAACGLPGAFVPLRFPRFLVVAAIPSDESTWRDVVLAYVERQGGTVNVSDLYRAFARHPKAARNPNWRAKVRQTLQRAGATRTAASTWSLAHG